MKKILKIIVILISSLMTLAFCSGAIHFIYFTFLPTDLSDKDKKLVEKYQFNKKHLPKPEFFQNIEKGFSPQSQTDDITEDQLFSQTFQSLKSFFASQLETDFRQSLDDYQSDVAHISYRSLRKFNGLFVQEIEQIINQNKFEEANLRMLVYYKFAQYLEHSRDQMGRNWSLIQASIALKMKKQVFEILETSYQRALPKKDLKTLYSGIHKLVSLDGNGEFWMKRVSQKADFVLGAIFAGQVREAVRTGSSTNNTKAMIELLQASVPIKKNLIKEVETRFESPSGNYDNRKGFFNWHDETVVGTLNTRTGRLAVQFLFGALIYPPALTSCIAESILTVSLRNLVPALPEFLHRQRELHDDFLAFKALTE